MEITKTLLLNGKPTLIKDKEYLATKEYVEPFLKEMYIPERLSVE